MNFRDAVRKRKIIAPNRRGFATEEWRQHAAKLAHTASDLNLVQAGEWFFKNFEETRTKHLLVNRQDINRFDKLRAILSASNQSMLEMQNNIYAQFDELENSRRATYISDEFRNIKLTTLSGTSLPSDDAAESIIAGTQKALRAIMQTEDTKGSKKAYIKEALSDINLGIYYYVLEATWERLLWEEYDFIPGELITIRPSDTKNIDAFVATRARLDRLNGSLYQSAAEHFIKKRFNSIYTYIRPVIDIVRDGRHQRLVLGEMHNASKAAISAFVMRHAVRQQFYGDIWITESKNLNGLSLERVLAAWEVISTASELLINRLLRQDYLQDNVKANSPSFEIHALCEAIKVSANVPYQTARRLIDFLTYEGKDNDDLWAKPLVRIANDRVAPVLLAASAPELRRTIDIWLADLNIVVEDKGHIFNRSVQELIAQSLAKSKHFTEAKVLIGNFELPISKGKFEEIDLLIIIGKFVILGECKCKVLPNEPRDWHKHRELINDAVKQIKRKSDAVKNNPQTFVDKIKKRGIELPSVYEILPIVVLNTGLHAGIPFEGIPVVDLPILETYISGYINNGTTEREDGMLDIIPKLNLYNNTQEAHTNLTEYLNAPPQLRVLRESVKDISISLPKLDDPRSLVAIIYSREVEINTTRYVLPPDQNE